MRIALVHYRYGPGGGGMDEYVVDLAQGFSERGDSVMVWTYAMTPGFVPPKNVAVRVVPFKPRWWASRKIAFYTEIVRELDPRDYDLVIGTMRTSKQHINVNGGTHIGYSRDVYKKFKHTDVIPIFFELMTLRRTPRIVAHSKKIAAEIEKDYGVSPAKISVLYPPSSERRYNLELRKNRAQWMRKYDVNPEKYSVFFPSTNHEIKGLSALLDAFSRLPQNGFELLIAGAPLDATPLPPNVRYLGFVSAIEELYVACDVMILPSLYDGFGLVVTESIACGTPVIVSKNAGVSEIIAAPGGERVGIVLDTPSAATIAEAIRAAKRRSLQRSFMMDGAFLFRHGLTPRQHVEAIAGLGFA